jgi:hypothetical protein
MHQKAPMINLIQGGKYTVKFTGSDGKLKEVTALVTKASSTEVHLREDGGTVLKIARQDVKSASIKK